MEERVEFPQVMSKGSQHNQMCRKFMHPMFTVALFINMIAQTWKQPKCPSTEQWINEVWYMYAMEYYSAIKENDIMPATWMDLEIIILS